MDNNIIYINEFLTDDHSYVSIPSTSKVNAAQVLSENIEFHKMEYKWNENNSKKLIDVYSKLKDKVGTFEIKNCKILWEKVAKELQNENLPVTPNNCLNRWRVLERNYKKFVDNNKKTGRGKKYFEYQKEMEAIFGDKKNIHPEILLTSDSIHKVQEEAMIEDDNVEKENELKGPQDHKTSRLQGSVSRRNLKRTRETTIEKMRLDRKSYYNERIEIEKKKVELLEKRNALIEERNNIMKEKMCVCHNNLST